MPVFDMFDQVRNIRKQYLEWNSHKVVFEDPMTTADKIAGNFLHLERDVENLFMPMGKVLVDGFFSAYMGIYEALKKVRCTLQRSEISAIAKAVYQMYKLYNLPMDWFYEFPMNTYEDAIITALISIFSQELHMDKGTVQVEIRKAFRDSILDSIVKNRTEELTAQEGAEQTYDDPTPAAGFMSSQVSMFGDNRTSGKGFLNGISSDRLYKEIQTLVGGELKKYLETNDEVSYLIPFQQKSYLKAMLEADLVVVNIRRSDIDGPGRVVMCTVMNYDNDNYLLYTIPAQNSPDLYGISLEKLPNGERKKIMIDVNDDETSFELVDIT